MRKSHTSDFQNHFLPAFTFAHLARWAAAIFLRAAADITRVAFAAPFRVLEAQLCPSRFLREADLPASGSR
jgi:glutathione S-transferase